MNQCYISEWIELYTNQKISLRKMEKIYNISRFTISNSLKEAGVTISKRKYSINETYFDEIKTKETAYILGYLYSDGCVFANPQKGDYGIKFKLQERDREILEFIKKELQTKIPISTESLNSREYLSLRINSKKIFNSLLSYGLMPNKTHKLTYPNNLFDSSPGLERAFILGIFDGDGTASFNTSRKQPIFEISGTRLLLSGIKNVLENNLDLKKVSLRICKNKRTYKLAYSGSKVVSKISKWLYHDQPFFLERKQQVFSSINHIPRYGKNIIKFKCPECQSTFTMEARLHYQLKKYTFKAKFCSLSCSGKFTRRWQLNNNKLTDEMIQSIDKNIVTHFKEYKFFKY